MGRKSNIEKEEKAAEQYAPMDFDEITRRLRNGADIQTLADLHGWGYTKMVSRLQYLEKKHGRQLLTPEIMRPSHRKMYLAMKKAKEKEKAAGLPEDMPVIVTNDYSCKGCAHCIQTSFGLLCKMGHECAENCVCSDYKTFPAPAQVEKPEFLQKKMNLPEVPPEDLKELAQDPPEEKPEIPMYVYEGKAESIKMPVIIPPPEVYSSAALMPETMDEIERNIEACQQLAARYRQQAEDWKLIRQAFQFSFKGRKLPEVQS